MLLLSACGAYGQIIDPHGGFHIVKTTFESFPLRDSICVQIDTVAQYNDPVDSNYRRLFFIHGLSGNAASLSRLADACENTSANIPGFPARKVHTTCVDYSTATQSSLNYAATVVRNKMREVNALDYSGTLGFYSDPKRAIVIGHSQGAMVGRALYYLECLPNNTTPVYGRDFGGFVSMGGPLQGAIIINNVFRMLDMANDACVSLSAGPLSQPVLDYVLANFFGNNYRQQMCNAVSHTILPLIMDSYTDNITNDYKFWSENLWTYNNNIWCDYYTSSSKVAFYGVEPRENILWRTTNWIVNNPNDCGYFQANDDFSFLNNTIIPLQQRYNQKYNYYKQKREHELTSAAAMCWLEPITAASLTAAAAVSEKRMNAWKKGVDWFSRANYQWEVCIGAIEQPNCTNTTMYRCPCSNTTGYYQTPDYCINMCGSAQPITITTVSINHKLNDGIVLAESACNLPAMTNLPVRLYYIPGSGENQYNRGTSHMQMRNDGSIKTAFNSLFEGEYGCFFKTSRY
jgi:pimeloyl-ACP methyl ester carboxylesterase